jgi:hypothetical protein
MQGGVMPRFDIGVVFGRFFKLLGENFGLFAIIGLIGTVLPAVASSLISQSLVGTTQVWSEAFQSFGPASIAILCAVVLFAFAINLMTLSAITEVAILRAVDKPVQPGALLGNAFRNIIPIFVISLLVGIFVVLGFIILIIPGIFLAICLCVAVPAYVGQPGIGIWGAIQKSFELTDGNRWWLLLIGIVIFVAAMIIGGAFGMLMLGVALAGGNISNVATSLPVEIANAFLSGIMNLLSYIFAAATYVTLRESKEKLSPDNAAEVFS